MGKKDVVIKFVDAALKILVALVVCTSPYAIQHTLNKGLGNHNTGWPFENVKFNHPIQSPVDLVTSKADEKELPVLQIVESVQQNKNAEVLNSGHTVYVYLKEDISLKPHLIGGPLKEKFVFEQMHFHWGSEDIWGSEHMVDGESYAAEIHIVHFNFKYGTFDKAASQPDGLAVLTIFVQGASKDNPLLDPLYKLLPKITNVSATEIICSKKAMQWARSAMGINPYYYAYPGSLTTPPYSENVVFILLPKPITLSLKQLAAFRELDSVHHDKILANRRDVQPLHNRPIVRSVARVV